MPDQETLDLFAKFARPSGVRDYVAWLWQQIENKAIHQYELRKMAAWPDEAFQHFEFPMEVKSAVDWACEQPVHQPLDPADEPEEVYDLGLDTTPEIE